MASDLKFVEYICRQCGIGTTYRRIFGEFGICYQNKLVGMICDNKLYVLITYSGNDYLIDCFGKAEKVEPFDGAGYYFKIDFDDNAAILSRLIIKTYCELT